MNDEIFGEIERFNNDFRPEAGRKAGLEILPDGAYDFAILGIAGDRTPQSRDPILRWHLRVIGGPCDGQEVERLSFLTSQEGIDRLGGDLATLGFDTASWKAPARPFSVELQKALPRLIGMRFRASKQANKSGEKVYQNLYLSGRLSGSSTPPPAAVTPPAAPRPAQPTAFQQPVQPTQHDDEEIPF